MRAAVGSVDLEAAELLILRNVFQAAGRLVEKDTKTHAAHRLALSDNSVGLLDEHRRRCAERAEACGVRLSEDAYVFSFDPARPATNASRLGDAPVLKTREAAWCADEAA